MPAIYHGAGHREEGRQTVLDKAGLSRLIHSPLSVPVFSPPGFPQRTRPAVAYHQPASAARSTLVDARHGISRMARLSQAAMKHTLVMSIPAFPGPVQDEIRVIRQGVPWPPKRAVGIRRKDCLSALHCTALQRGRSGVVMDRCAATALLLQGNQLVLPPAKRRDPEAMRDCDAIQCDLMRCDTMRYSGGRYRIPAAPARLASLCSRACAACTSRLVPPLHSNPHERLRLAQVPVRTRTCTRAAGPLIGPPPKARRNEWLVQEGARAIGRPTRGGWRPLIGCSRSPSSSQPGVSGFISVLSEAAHQRHEYKYQYRQQYQSSSQHQHRGLRSRAPASSVRLSVCLCGRHGNGMRWPVRRSTCCGLPLRTVRRRSTLETGHYALCDTTACSAQCGDASRTGPSHGHAPLRPRPRWRHSNWCISTPPQPHTLPAPKVSDPKHHHTPPLWLLRPTSSCRQAFPVPSSLILAACLPPTCPVQVAQLLSPLPPFPPKKETQHQAGQNIYFVPQKKKTQPSYLGSKYHHHSSTPESAWRLDLAISIARFCNGAPLALQLSASNRPAEARPSHRSASPRIVCPE
ncbi:uncharacterized protein Triagg1_4284 [Trichoderma aggressivum f. europaeum]|uniref:Uncharacterized protein n=1 Tax=Trichoderma aggressivum f. europaeum TaxID=173218 RepID=A0AAE1IF09_9HYPO|nr:hypothetical protein Triagg1_4284 [Trichoderma aggressivum f. europaeum]